MLNKLKKKKIIILIKNSILEFLDDNGLKLSASLSYSTIFALPSLAILIVSSISLFFTSIEGDAIFFNQMSEIIGQEPTSQIREMMQKVDIKNSSKIAQLISIGVLLFSASAIFAEIQSSINFIWEIKAKSDKGIKRIIMNRLFSFLMIGILGLILILSIIINTSIEFLFLELSKLFTEKTMYLAKVLNIVIIFLVVMGIFSFIFKTLPDGKLKWKDTLIGASFTSVLFMIGTVVIGKYLIDTSKIEIYGPASSILILLIWIYYSAIILYFGVIFTKNYSEIFGSPIVPNDFSVRVKIEETEIEYEEEK